MTTHDATEQAFRNGYEKGKKDAVKHGHWIDTGLENSTGSIYKCSCCFGIHNPNKKDVATRRMPMLPDWCYHCGAMMNEAIE